MMPYQPLIPTDYINKNKILEKLELEYRKYTSLMKNAKTNEEEVLFFIKRETIESFHDALLKENNLQLKEDLEEYNKLIMEGIK